MTDTKTGRTVKVLIPNGYETAVTDVANQNPELTALEAAKRFVEKKYGSWIAANLSEAFTIEMEDDRNFLIHFERASEAQTFIAVVGGR